MLELNFYKKEHVVVQVHSAWAFRLHSGCILKDVQRIKGSVSVAVMEKDTE